MKATLKKHYLRNNDTIEIIPRKSEIDIIIRKLDDVAFNHFWRMIKIIRLNHH
jgi:hypothetical protein